MSTTAADFWNQLGSTNKDVEELYKFLLERGSPAPSSELARHLIALHWRDEQQRLAQAASRTSAAYQPKSIYTVGQRIQFPAPIDREGTVKKIRAGDNPRLGAFQVMTIKFDDDSKTHEFAMAYARPHPLNEEPEQSKTTSGMTQEQIIAEYGEGVRARLIERLNADKEFVHAGDEFFLKELIPSMDLGYLNLAEAAIEQNGDAIRTTDLLKVLDMPDKGAASLFALNRALSNDPRFDDVGPIGDSRWFLTRLEPPEAIEYPALLHAARAHVGTLAPELETIAEELQDEADLNGDLRSIPIVRDEITIILTYPHRRAGTLPLTPVVRALLPEFSRARFKFNFQDATTVKKFGGVAVSEGNYIAGLTQVFNAWRLSPGAMITLKRGADPFTIVIDPQLQRERGLWVRVARVADGRLTFGQERRPLAHKYDEEMLIVIGDPVGVERLNESPQSKLPLGSLLEEIFPELAQLSSARNVHAKTLYSGVNFVKRVGPRAVLSALSESHAFSSTGGGYFVLNA